MKNKMVLCLIYTFLLLGCDTKKIEPQEISFDNDYLPLSEFDITYDVIEITYNTLGSDTLHYTQKEKTIKYEKNGNQETNTFLIEQTGVNKLYSKRLVAKYLNDNQEIVLESNKSELLLILPLAKDNSFNLNKYNLEPSNLGRIQSIDQKNDVVIDSKKYSFDESLFIQFNKKVNSIDNIDHYRIYQKSKGLVLELNQNINFQPGQKASGFKYLKILKN